MQITLARQEMKSGPRNWTLGRLTTSGGLALYTCEDPVRPWGPKVPGETAIPAGQYMVEITQSQRFGRLLPLLWNVQRDGAKLCAGAGMEFSGIRIHPGNTPADTDGCVLPGLAYYAEGVLQSRAAFEPLYAEIAAALAAGDAVFMDVVNAPMACVIQQPIA